MNLVNKHKLVSIKAVLALISIAVLFSFPVNAFAIHQTSELGDSPIYGHFGQPHEYVLSGEFEFIAEVKGDLDRVEFSIFKSGESLDVNNAIAREVIAEPSYTYGGFNYYKFLWNSQATDDGDYKLFGNIQCDDCTPNGWQDYISHHDGMGYLRFMVDNPETSPPPNVDQGDVDCTAESIRIKELSSKLYKKHQNNLQYIDDFLQHVNLFYERSDIKIANYDEILTDITSTRNSASNALALLESFSPECNVELSSQVREFISNSVDTRNKLDNYKNGVIELTLKIIKEV